MLNDVEPLEIPTIGQNHILQRDYLKDRHIINMEKIKKQNVDVKKYWILGWTVTSKKAGRTRITPKMATFFDKPEITKESYLYEIDNVQKTQTLVWVMHPNNKLSLPSVGKLIHVADDRA